MFISDGCNSNTPRNILNNLTSYTLSNGTYGQIYNFTLVAYVDPPGESSMIKSALATAETELGIM